ncbi:MAG: type IV secretion system protein [Devosiaceae bacterium]|nr:type IV secretion system protein [Devosiaceae bacterium]
MNDLNIIDQFMQTFVTYIDSGFGLLSTDIAFLTTILIGIDITLAGLFWALSDDKSVIPALIKKVLYIGVFAYIINNFAFLSMVIFESFAGLGLRATGTGLSIADLMRPGFVAATGYQSAEPILAEVSNLIGPIAFFENFVTIAVLMFAWAVVLLAFFILAIQLFITILGFWLQQPKLLNCYGCLQNVLPWLLLSKLYDIGGIMKKTNHLILTLMGYVGFFIATYGVVVFFFNRADLDLLVAVIYVMGLCTLLIVVFVFRQLQISRKEKYANITEKIHRVNHITRDIQTVLLHNKDLLKSDSANFKKDDDDRVAALSKLDKCIESQKVELIGLLDIIGSSFEMLTGTRCRVAIKLIVTHSDGKSYVDAFVRDKISMDKWGEHDLYRVINDHDKLKDNIVFKTLFSNDNYERKYLSNNIQEDAETNTSVKAYRKISGAELDEVNNKVKQLLKKIKLYLPWTSQSERYLPYRSTLTCAIRQREIVNIGYNVEMLGFLCIDSESRGVFDKRWDEHICFSFADALYRPINELLILMDLYENNKGKQ